MYISSPAPTDTMPEVDGMNQLKFKLVHSNVDVPEHIDQLLQKFGWQHSMYHPDTQEELFRKPPPDNCTDERKAKWPHDLQFGHWHWYEAMAYEFGKFVTLEDDSEKPSMNPNGAASASSAPEGGTL